MAGVTSAVIGGGLGLLGAKKSAAAQKDAARMAAESAEFRPFNISGGGLGSVSFNTDSNTASVQATPLMEALRGGLSGLTLEQLAGSGGINDVLGAGQMAAGQLPGLFTGAQQDIGDAYSMLSGATGQFGNTIQGLLSQFRSDALAPGVVDESSNFAIQQGQNLLSQDPNSVISSTLQNLRAQARPEEERAVNARVQQLFNKGILSSTSGARSMGELAQAQEMADINRQLVAEQAGLSRFNAQQTAGQGLFSMGQSGLLQGQQLNQQLAGLGANVGFTSAQGLFDAQGQLSNALQNRGANRLAMAQNLFGFGQNANIARSNVAAQNLQGMLGINQDLRNLIALGGNIGGQQAAAGANVGQFIQSGAGSGTGGFLSGLGTGLMQQGINAIFKPQPPAEGGA